MVAGGANGSVRTPSGGDEESEKKPTSTPLTSVADLGEVPFPLDTGVLSDEEKGRIDAILQQARSWGQELVERIVAVHTRGTEYTAAQFAALEAGGQPDLATGYQLMVHTKTEVAELNDLANRIVSLLQDTFDSCILPAPQVAAVQAMRRDLAVQRAQLDVMAEEVAQELGEVPRDLSKLARLVIAIQPFPVSVKQHRALTDQPTIVRLISGTRLKVAEASMVTTEVVRYGEMDDGGAEGDSNSGPRSKKSSSSVSSSNRKNPAVMVSKAEATLGAEHSAAFTSMNFPVGSRLKTARLRFVGTVAVYSLSGASAVLPVQSEESGAFIVMTNENQWDECEGVLLRDSLFGSGTPEHGTAVSPGGTVSWARFCNVLHARYVVATRQSTGDPTRPLEGSDFHYFASIGFGHNGQVTGKECRRFWLWFGPFLHRIRYQRHVISLWFRGYIVGFMSRQQITAALLATGKAGVFGVRCSERVAGQFVVSYTTRGDAAAGDVEVRHYLIKESDTAGAKKTLPDFLADYSSEFRECMYVKRDPVSGDRALRLIDKDAALQEFYSKRVDKSFSGYDEHVKSAAVEM
jgi:hypothetical protein